MSGSTVVIKLGGDALASPERIAAAARRVAHRAAAGPVIAVVSARRGVTDHLLGLVDQVRNATGGGQGDPVESDRAVAAGEVVSAALLALALTQSGVPAVSLDARQAGLRSTGRSGHAHIRAVAAGRLRRLLESGTVPVVTGFQGWHEGRVVTLARGGTDVTAVAIAVAVGAQRVEFVKDAPGLLSADPKVVPEARAIPEASHGFLSALAAAGARVIHPEAARLAERNHLPLEFHALEGERALTVIRGDDPERPLHAVAASPAENGVVLVTALTTRPPAERAQLTDSLRKALGDAGLPILDVLPGANGPRFAVPAALAPLATRALHTVFLEHTTTTGDHVRRAS